MLKQLLKRKLKEVLVILLHYTHVYMREFNYPYIQRVDHNKWVICKAFPKKEFVRKCTAYRKIPGLFEIKYFNEVGWVLTLRHQRVWESTISTIYTNREKAQRVLRGIICHR